MSELDPHPTHVVVGHAAKARIDSHPHHTVYHAKRALGAAFNDPAVIELRNEVEFELIENNTDVAFRVPFHKDYKDGRKTDSVSMPPHRVGSYVVHHLMKMASDYLGHGNVKSAVIAVPAKFNQAQIRQQLKHSKMLVLKSRGSWRNLLLLHWHMDFKRKRMWTIFWCMTLVEEHWTSVCYKCSMVDMLK